MVRMLSIRSRHVYCIPSRLEYKRYTLFRDEIEVPAPLILRLALVHQIQMMDLGESLVDAAA